MKANTQHGNGKCGRKKSLLLIASSPVVKMAALVSLPAIVAMIIGVQPRPRAPQHGDASPILHYVHSGRLVADLRTAAAMVEFILEPVPPDLPVTSPAHAG